ncbi:hypothetical protein [Deinococcus multiflagellatus]|uniref:DUF1190 domain-containing protein n=1 Tax=Deinococcus multiflagellatus TaxID=1656887 RepID=A0ABW1ZHN0_9DEIO|nr:hypothetical protein [Deinococcus multiflagellatus]MBZ9714527.1 hypothetical protein [Deinococcus multiflagellatus]
MRKRFTLPLLAALPAVLAACNDDLDLDRYSRVRYNSYADCLAANRTMINRGLSNPCQKSSGGYYGPYARIVGSTTRYIGYSSSGGLSSSGLTYDSKKGTYGSFKAPVSRGGFTSSARAGSSSSGSS